MRRFLRRGIASTAAQDAMVLTCAVDGSPLRKIRSPQLRAPTKNSDGKTPSDIFMSACPHTRGAVYFWACFYAVTSISAPSQRASITLPRATFHACAMRKHFTRRSNDRRISCLRDSADIFAAGRSLPGFLTCPLRGLFLGLVEA